MKKMFIVAVSTAALVGFTFLPAASAMVTTSDGVGTGIDAAGETGVAPPNLQGAPLPDLASRLVKSKKDNANKLDVNELFAAAERSGVEALDISKSAIDEFNRTQDALQGKTRSSDRALVGTGSPHYFGPYGNFAYSPQRLPTALVTFSPPPGAGRAAEGTAVVSSTGVVTGVTVTDPGAGYSKAPSVKFTNTMGAGGTGAAAKASLSLTLDSVTITNPGSGYNDPVTVTFEGGGVPDASDKSSSNASHQAQADAVLGSDGSIVALNITDFGAGYTSAPTVTIKDKVGDYRPAKVTATVSMAVGSVDVTRGGRGYILPGLRKFVDTLAGMGAAGENNLGQYIPVGKPDTTTYPESDYYEIAVVQYRERMHSDLPAAGTLLRGYVQVSTSVVPGKRVPLCNASKSPGAPCTPAVDANGAQVYGVDKPHYLGPTILAEKDRPVRVKFMNLLPTGVAGDLFLPVDTTVMGSGQGPNMTPTEANRWGMGENPQNPDCGRTPKPDTCYTENRTVAHLHGGATPWISDGTPHQWITPAGEKTAYPEGVSLKNVPDMPDPGPGAVTFYYTNQQSSRLMFYHDHAWGTTRLNVYAGLAAPYIISDDMEKALIANATIPGPADTIPLVIQDKTFVPSSAELAIFDPTWDESAWGTRGNLWLPHVYMTAQNPYDASGVNQFGRWAYGPWFWPPTMNLDFMPIPNPYRGTPGPCDTAAGAVCDPPTYTTIPATPNESMGMEAFNDTPVVNGTAYPTLKVDPKAYRVRILNAASDRFFSLSLYEASGKGCVPSTGKHCTEVALDPKQVEAAKSDPDISPTPVAKPGPDWVMVGTDSGFLPNPVIIPPQPITFVTDPTVFNVGNVDTHALFMGPAERTDSVVDFSQYAGKTLILYNDAPAANPARVPYYDPYTDNADLRDIGGPYSTPEGYGPNIRTVMQIVVGPSKGRAPYNTAKLFKAFRSTSDGGGGVFEQSQHPIVVGQAAYNKAYGTEFGKDLGASVSSFDGFARITDDAMSYNTLRGTTFSPPLTNGGLGEVLTVNLKSKAIHDEMGAAWDNMYGRMSGLLGVETKNNVAGLQQNLVLYPYVNPPTENFVGEALPPGTRIVPIVSMNDGTQIWKITHNGVDTHPIHFHFGDVQLINRVGWDGIIRPPDPDELGWKDTVRVSPLEDTIVAMRPLLPQAPFGIEQSKRPLNPSLPIDSPIGFVSIKPDGTKITPAYTNVMTNFDWEYVWHCHILSHEEMDMMHPLTVSQAIAVPDASLLTAASNGPNGVVLTWSDPTPAPVNGRYVDTWGNPKNEVGYRLLRQPLAEDGTAQPWREADGNLRWGVDVMPALANQVTLADPGGGSGSYAYMVVSWNAEGSTDSNTLLWTPGGTTAPTAPTNVVGTPAALAISLTWKAPAANGGTALTGYTIERSLNGSDFAWLTTVAGDATTYQDAGVSLGTDYWYRVTADNGVGPSVPSGVVGPIQPKKAA